MHDHNNYVFNYNQITEHIYVGNNQCCILELNELLVKEDIYADISLEEKLTDNPIGVGAFLWVPIKNDTAPESDQVKVTTAFIKTNVDMGKKIYVHCQNGHGRAPTIVIAYLMSTGQSFEDALALIKEKRPTMHLDESQIEFLKAIN